MIQLIKIDVTIIQSYLFYTRAFKKILYKSIIEGVEQSLSKDKDKFIMARVEDGKSVKDVEILRESFKTNLETVLNYYEQQEEYELCSRTLNLINQVQ